MYQYQGKDVSDIFALSKVMYLDSDYFAKEVRTPAFLEFVRQADVNKAERLKKLLLLSVPDDILVFRASLILNPYLSFRFKGYLFNDYAALGRLMLSSAPETNPVLMEVVRYSLVSLHLLFSSSGTQQEKVQEIMAIEKEGANDLSYAYFLLAYDLSKTTTLIYQKKEYSDIFNFVYYLRSSKTDLAELGNYLADSPLLRAYSHFSKDGKLVEEYLHLNRELDLSEKGFLDATKKREEAFRGLKK